MDIPTLLNETIALKAAKEDMVEMLREKYGANATTPLSEIADMMRAEGSCLTPRLACFDTRRGTYQFFTRAEWEEASESTGFNYLLMLGLELRAEGHRFIISGLGKPYMQLSTSGLDVACTYYGADCLEAAVDDFDGAGNTDKIIAAGDNAGVDTPGPDWAKSYKTLKNKATQDGDPQHWYIPALGELLLMQKYKKRINEEITWFRNNPRGLFQADDLTLLYGAQFWSSTQFNSQWAWLINLSVGGPACYGKYNGFDVRPISAIVTP